VLRQLGLQESDTLEVVALDSFVAQIPGALALRQQAPPRLAIEEEGASWPVLPGQSSSAGPFYIVWPDNTGVASEQWPYAVARLSIQQNPDLRWPQPAVSASLPPDDPARRGQAVFIVQCLACHRMNGGGVAQVGPDLNLPANPTEYFQPQALRRLIRAPESLRSWPGQAMPAFPADTLSDTALNDLLAYLEHMPLRREATR
jgi:mono/diheme cytochrome c family protein